MTEAAVMEDPGIRCRKCGCQDMPVKRTMPAMNGKIKRYRYCRHCGTSRVTLEVSIADVKRPDK